MLLEKLKSTNCAFVECLVFILGAATIGSHKVQAELDISNYLPDEEDDELDDDDLDVDLDDLDDDVLDGDADILMRDETAHMKWKFSE
jgi:hypothetical protein